MVQRIAIPIVEISGADGKAVEIAGRKLSGYFFDFCAYLVERVRQLAVGGLPAAFLLAEMCGNAFPRFYGGRPVFADQLAYCANRRT